MLIFPTTWSHWSWSLWWVSRISLLYRLFVHEPIDRTWPTWTLGKDLWFLICGWDLLHHIIESWPTQRLSWSRFLPLPSLWPVNLGWCPERWIDPCFIRFMANVEIMLWKWWVLWVLSKWLRWLWLGNISHFLMMNLGLGFYAYWSFLRGFILSKLFPDKFKLLLIFVLISLLFEFPWIESGSLLTDTVLWHIPGRTFRSLWTPLWWRFDLLSNFRFWGGSCSNLC